MNNKLIFRSFNDEDYTTVFEWWNWWWGKEKGIERSILPHNDYCYIIEKNNTPVAAAFLYVDKNAPIGYLTFIVSNPEYKENDRRLIIEQLITNIEEEAKSQGIKFVFTICESIHMQNIHNKLGWTISKAPSYETFKYI
jgi:N-acetylglutamate synthase-like GNAT family acetyltransferase